MLPAEAVLPAMLYKEMQQVEQMDFMMVVACLIIIMLDPVVLVYPEVEVEGMVA